MVTTTVLDVLRVAWYWNKIRRDFPDVYDEMAKAERELGRSCLKSTFLDELEPQAGREQKIIMPDCGNFCDIEFADVMHKKVEDVYQEPQQLRLL